MTPPLTPADLVQGKSRTLLGITDLTLVADIKPGPVPAADSRSHETRLMALLNGLSTLRSLSLEARPLFPDTIDAVRAIQSFRLAVIGETGKRQLVLSVAFDGGWEPYMRRIYRDLGTLLDVIFCNCQGYPLSTESTFAQYTAWVRTAQVPTAFFYNASALTVNDYHFLREQATRVATGAPGRDAAGGAAMAPPTPSASPPEAPSLAAHRKSVLDALPAISALYRLADLYPPGSTDGDVLLRAVRFLLAGPFAALGAVTAETLAGWLHGHAASERAAVRWLLRPTAGSRSASAPSPGDTPDPAQAQAGVLDGIPAIRQGCVALLGLRDAAAAKALLDHLLPQIRPGGEVLQHDEGLPQVNVYLTLSGLVKAGVPRGQLEVLPSEFRDGMAARSSILGDWQDNHPTRWSLPERNWPSPQAGHATRVQLSDVDVVLHLSLAADPARTGDPAHGSEHPLVAWLDSLSRRAGGVELLSVQFMQRRVDGQGQTVGHFGFADGLSQPRPVVPGRAQPPTRDDVPVGDLLLGFPNGLGDSPALRGRLWDASSFVVLRKLRQDVQAFRHGLEVAAADGLPIAPRAGDTDELDEARARMIGRWPNGRALHDSAPPPDQPGANEFDYAGDADGQQCPLWSHVRRTNPRETRTGTPADLKHVPRIMRRGMSYGPPVGGDDVDSTDRGLMFIAYNASIAEQFETVQAWVSGSNAAGAGRSYSGLRDPLLGMPLPGDPAHYPYVTRDDRACLARWRSGRPPVTLQWGLYAFVPSLPALALLRDMASDAAVEEQAEAARRVRDDAVGPPVPTPLADEQRQVRQARLAAIGALIIQRLELLERMQGPAAAAQQWKLLLEDPGARRTEVGPAAVWTAIRQLQGGVLRTPYGVLVCSDARAREVLGDRQGRYSVSGYAVRMRDAFGEIYLGRDEDDNPPGHAFESQGPNRAIGQITAEAAFELGLDAALDTVRARLDGPDSGPEHEPGEEVPLDVRDFVDGVLARACSVWFGIPDGHDVPAGGWSWAVDQPTCPGHFHAPSRYFFQPLPGDEAATLGRQTGQQLRVAVTAFVTRMLADGPAWGEWTARPIVDAICRTYALADDPAGRFGAAPWAGARTLARGEWVDYVARTLIGVMMGFLPTADGNLRGVIAEWILGGRLWPLQRALCAVWPAQTQTESQPQAQVQGEAQEQAESRCERAREVLDADFIRALQRRPVPESVWRTATVAHGLGRVDVRPGDVVVVSVAAGLHEAEAQPDCHAMDVSLLFGGATDPDGGPGCPRHAAAAGVHACPGYAMAMGFMRGALAGLLTAAELRPSVSAAELRVVRR